MEIKQLIKEAGETSKSKGFHEAIKSSDKHATGTLLMLIVSELSEALEADRKGATTNQDLYNKECLVQNEHGDQGFITAFKLHIKDTFEDEIADVFIRLGDLCYRYNIDIEKHIELKMRYNKTREKLHGKTY